MENTDLAFCLGYASGLKGETDSPKTAESKLTGEMLFDEKVVEAYLNGQDDGRAKDPFRVAIIAHHFPGSWIANYLASQLIP